MQCGVLTLTRKKFLNYILTIHRSECRQLKARDVSCVWTAWWTCNTVNLIIIWLQFLTFVNQSSVDVMCLIIHDWALRTCFCLFGVPWNGVLLINYLNKRLVSLVAGHIIYTRSEPLVGLIILLIKLGHVTRRNRCSISQTINLGLR